MSLNATGSNFLATEDDRSIGSFKTNASRFSFNLSKNICIKNVTKELVGAALVQVTVDEETDINLSLDLTLKNKNTEDNIIAENRRVTRNMSTSNEDTGTPMLESAVGAEIPAAHEQCRLLILRRGLDLRIAKTQHKISSFQRDVPTQPMCEKLKPMATT